ncbi:MAG TPA: YwqG family protein [Chloroflexia bacterium]|nr:YwqG family protein [Chloroflexia bacterium]
MEAEIRGMIRGTLPRVARELESLVQPSVRIRTQRVDEDSIPAGASKLGGHPDLPREISWPLSSTLVDVEDIPQGDDEPWNGIPLAFLAQLSLTDVAEYGLSDVLPRSGMLYFFLEVSDETYFGAVLEQRDSWRVLYYDGDLSLLVRAPYPDGLPGEGHFPACALQFSREITLPPRHAADLEGLKLSTRPPVDWSKGPLDSRLAQEDATSGGYEEDAYGAISDHLYKLYGEDAPIHRLLGYADQIQNDLQGECEVASRGLEWSDLANPEIDVSKWRLLLQIDSDEECGMSWGDAGRVYYFIEAEALQARDFSRVWTIMQCY